MLLEMERGSWLGKQSGPRFRWAVLREDRLGPLELAAAESDKGNFEVRSEFQ